MECGLSTRRSFSLFPFSLNSSRSGIRMNRGRGRRVPHIHVKEGIKVHRSVKLRMEAARRGHLFDVHGREATYVPRVKWDVEPEWVD